MSVQMTVNISDFIYNRVKNLASVKQQPLGEIVEQLLTNSLPVDEDETNAALDESDKALKGEIATFYLLHCALWQKYPNQHIALYQGEVVDHDPDGVALSLRIYQRFPNETVLIRQVEEAAERELRIRSPRFVRDGARR